MDHGILSPIAFEGEPAVEVSCLERTESGMIYFGTPDGIGYIDEERRAMFPESAQAEEVDESEEDDIDEEDDEEFEEEGEE